MLTAQTTSIAGSGHIATAAPLSQLSTPMLYARNTEIYGEGEPAEYIYQVISGAVRAYKILDDGRRQIGAFYLPGDTFGLEVGQNHRMSAEAISNCTVSAIKRKTLLRQAACDNDVALSLLHVTASELQRAEKHILLLVRTAQERVASFLLEMADRAAGAGTVELPMSRQDIADYLGLTIETVSRTLTALEAQEAIALPSSRKVRLINMRELRRLDS